MTRSILRQAQDERNEGFELRGMIEIQADGRIERR